MRCFVIYANNHLRSDFLTASNRVHFLTVVTSLQTNCIYENRDLREEVIILTILLQNGTVIITLYNIYGLKVFNIRMCFPRHTMIDSEISYLYLKLAVQGEKNQQKVKNIKCIHKNIHEYEYF